MEETRQIEYKLQDDRFKTNHIDNYIKWKWSKDPYKKTHIIKLD